MSPETEIRIALVLAALRWLQESGDAPPPGQVSPEYLSRLSHDLGESVSTSTWRKEERRTLAKIHHALSGEPSF